MRSRAAKARRAERSLARDRELESSRSVSFMDDVSGGDIAVCLCDAPQHRHDGEDKRMHNDVGQSEESVSAHGIDEGRHGELPLVTAFAPCTRIPQDCVPLP
jgi:hypothetical protein